MSCPTGNCKAKCGDGKANIKTDDEIMAVLCNILCETRKEFCEGKHKGKKRGQVAEDKAKKSQALKDAMRKSGGVPKVNKEKLVKFPRRLAGRSPLNPEQLAKKLDEMGRQFKKLVQRKLSKKSQRRGHDLFLS